VNSAYTVLLAICSALCVAAAIAHLGSALILQFLIDHDRVKSETGEPGWKIFGSSAAPEEFYKPSARPFWKIRQYSWKVLWVTFGAIFVIVLLEAVIAPYRKP
jgi:hypothetical protein